MVPKNILLLVLLLLCDTSRAANPFTDIEYAWYRDSVIDLQSQGLTNGYGDGTYGVNHDITRAEILTLLLRASNTTIPDVGTEKCFPDVDQNKWYHRSICTASKLGIAHGFGDGKFKPNNPVTTLEALAFANKIFETKVDTTGEPWYGLLQKFSDENHIIPTHSYTTDTQISRGKAADLIIRMQQFRKTNSPLNYKSTGCDKNPPIMSGENIIHIGDKERKYNLSIPFGYTNTREYSLIIATHGRTNSKDQVQNYMGLDRQSDTLVAYPAGLTSTSGKSFSWSEAENMTLIDAILKEVTDKYCINRDQVRIVGHSLGGWMAQRIACLRGEFVSGLAVVGSGGFVGTCSGPVPSLFFQNVDDHLSSYESGVNARNTRIKVNECDESQTENIQIGSLSCTKYTTCSPGNQVVWCEGYTGYNGDPHSWPTPNGGRDILEFLR